MKGNNQSFDYFPRLTTLCPLIAVLMSESMTSALLTTLEILITNEKMPTVTGKR